jgi:membrane-bound lytic murein transglycosylase F
MRRRITVFPLALMVFLLGCTPAGDSVVKRLSLEGEKGLPQAAATVSKDSRVVSLLDPTTLEVVKKYGPTIRASAVKYSLDWRLVLAMMRQESRFLPDARSHKGAMGLMQLMPLTAEEISRDIKSNDISHPSENIRGGVFYLRRLYDAFEGVSESERMKLALAAYNAGIGRIYDAQEVAAYFHDDPGNWQSIKGALPLLSKRYYTLHRNIWEQEKPKAGWFGNGAETVAYVDNVIQYYDEFRLLLN